MILEHIKNKELTEAKEKIYERLFQIAEEKLHERKMQIAAKLSEGTLTEDKTPQEKYKEAASKLRKDQKTKEKRDAQKTDGKKLEFHGVGNLKLAEEKLTKFNRYQRKTNNYFTKRHDEITRRAASGESEDSIASSMKLNPAIVRATTGIKKVVKEEQLDELTGKGKLPDIEAYHQKKADAAETARHNVSHFKRDASADRAMHYQTQAYHADKVARAKILRKKAEK